MENNRFNTFALVPTCLALATLLYGYYTWDRKPTSVRPAASEVQYPSLIGDQDIRARLWQDPFEAVVRSVTNSSLKDNPEELRRQIAERRREDIYPGPRAITILLAMMEAGPYPEDGETRLRVRYAIQSGLGNAGFRPYDREHLGYCRIPWPSGSTMIHTNVFEVTNKDAWPRMVVPFEWFHKGDRAALVIWISEEEFVDLPLSRFALLLHSIGEKPTSKNSVAVIGPRSSDTLLAIMEEAAARQGYHEKETVVSFLDNVTFYSPYATAPDFAFSDQVQAWDPDNMSPTCVSQNREALSQTLQRFLGFRSQPVLHNFITTDDQLARSLVDELRVRQVRFEKTTNFLGRLSPADHVALLAESDTTYGRTLPFLVAAAAIGPLVQSHKCSHGSACLVEEYAAAKTNWPENFSLIGYVRGLDGSKPQGGSGETDKTASAEEQLEAFRRHETSQPQGDAQLDYVRRMVQQLKSVEKHSETNTGGRLRAIGVLGSDVYDKLILLQPLKKAFPEAIFFTTDLDARYLHPSQFNWARNLVVASGQRLDPNQPGAVEFHLPPFRDAYQTAVFNATLSAVGRPAGLKPRPRLYEIGRQNAVPLDPKSTDPWPLTNAQMRGVAMLLVGIMGLAFMVPLVQRLQKAHHMPFGSSYTKLRMKRDRWCFILIGILILSTLVVAWHGHIAAIRNGEPFSWSEGVSVWPTEIIRVAAFFLAIIFLVYGWGSQRLHILDLLNGYFDTSANLELSSQPPVRQRPPLLLWPLALLRRRFELAISGWPPPSPTEPVISAGKLFEEYLKRQWITDRFLRVIWYTAFYGLFGFGIIFLIDGKLPEAPARGSSAVAHDVLILICTVTTYLITSFYALDAIRLTTRMLRRLGDRPTAWPETVVNRFAEKTGIQPDHLSWYIDVLFVTDHTKFVGKLIYYPFTLLLLMIVARSTFFDNWTWPPGLVILFAFNGLVLFVSALALRYSAARVRTDAVRHLQDVQLHHTGRPGGSDYGEKIGLAIGTIKGLRQGAYSSFFADPAFTALLLPSGGYSLIALLQRFFF